MINCKIFIKKNPATNDKFNKNLMKFLINNVSSIVENDIFVRIILVTKNNINSVQSVGVKSTPALICGSESKVIVGVDNIIKKIINLCEKEEERKPSPSSVRKELNEEDDCDVKSMLMGILNSGDDNDNDIDGPDLKKKIQDRLNHNSQGEATTRSNPAIYQKLKENNEYSGRESIDMSVNTGNATEDDAMSKYWANQETTDI
jgi:hypothetical protein